MGGGGGEGEEGEGEGEFRGGRVGVSDGVEMRGMRKMVYVMKGTNR